MTAVDPELAPIVKRLPAMPIRRWMLPVLRGLMRVTSPKADLNGVEVSEQESAGVRVRVLRPLGREPTGALLWMHGGGLVVGAPKQDDARCAAFVRELGVVVVSAYYRLAPRHPFPAAIDDCAGAWRWLLDNLEQLGVPPGRVGVGGESAGGGLAASLAQRLRDEGDAQPAWQLLVYPMLDDRTAARRDLDALKHPVWNNGSNLTGWSSYLGHAPGGASAPPYAVPSRCDDVSGLAPAWIGVGHLDLFLEENRDYAKRLAEAGVDCELVEVPGAVHGFIALAPTASISRDFTNRQFSFLRAHLEPTTQRS